MQRATRLRSAFRITTPNIRHARRLSTLAPRSQSMHVSLRPALFVAAVLLAPRLSLRSMSTTGAPLDPTLFNPALFRSLLGFWFAGLPATTSIPDFATGKRWFGLFDDPADRIRFDADCKALSGSALAALGPEQYPLPPFQSFDVDRREAAALSAGLRERVNAAAGGTTDGTEPGAAPLPLADAALAMVLLLDQMPRNSHRDLAGQKLVYEHYDRLARSLVHYMLDPANEDDALYGIDRSPRLQSNLARRQFLYLPLQHSEDVRDHLLNTERNGDLREGGTDEEKAYMQQGDGFAARHQVLLERFGRYPHRNKALGREATQEETEFLEGGGDTFGTG